MKHTANFMVTFLEVDEENAYENIYNKNIEGQTGDSYEKGEGTNKNDKDEKPKSWQ